MKHRIGVAVPVVAAVPTGGGQQAAAGAAVRVASGHLPGNVLGIGIDHVQAHGADGPGRFMRFIHRLGAGQLEEGIQRLVGFELGGLQGNAQATLQLHRLQHVLALAEHAVEQRAVAGFEQGFADRPLALDEEGLLAGGGRQPLAIGQIQQAIAFTADFFEEQVLVVGHDHGHAPGQLAVEAGDHGRYAGDRDASGLIARRADVDEGPHRGHGNRQVGVVGQQALAVTRLLGGDGPVVRGSHAEHVEGGDLLAGLVDLAEALQLAGEAQALELLCFIEGQWLVRVDRAEPGQFVGADLLRQDQRGDFLLQVHRQAEVEQAEDQHRVLGLPVGRPVAGLGQVHRQLVLVAIQVGVDPAGIDLEELLQLR